MNLVLGAKIRIIFELASAKVNNLSECCFRLRTFVFHLCSNQLQRFLICSKPFWFVQNV